MKTLGFDTSNYTTSCALFENGQYAQERQLLPVKAGERGIRQSDAVFHHTAQLAQLTERLLAGDPGSLQAVGASVRPRDVEGSYMPCFSVGAQSARILGAALGIPVFLFSHQAGHIAAGLVSAGRQDLMQRPFLAFHCSGGTTELLRVNPDRESVFACRIVGCTEDLNAGQVIDRTGVRLGLQFPCGKALESLALTCEDSFSPRVCVRNGCCSLSGLENQCVAMIERAEPAARVARYCFSYLETTIVRMVESALDVCGDLPILFVGGVMSNSLLRSALAARFDACFASPALSCDNAVGIAALASFKGGGWE